MYSDQGPCAAAAEPSIWQMRFVGDRVRATLTKFGLAKHVGVLLSNHEDEFGMRRLTFVGFRQIFPTFPVVLEAQFVPGIGQRCRPADLFRTFGDSALTEAYLEAYARLHIEADGRPIGLIVPFDSYRGGVIVHNGAFDSRGTRLIHDVVGDRPPYRITIEPYDRFLTYLARGGWPPADEAPARAARAGRTIALAPKMVKRLGTGPALVVYSWLSTIMASSVGLDRRYVRLADNGERFVVATQGDIARQTGLGLDAVKRGLARLRKEDLIVARRWRSLDCIILQEPESL